MEAMRSPSSRPRASGPHLEVHRRETETLPQDLSPPILATNAPTTIPASQRIKRRWLPSGRLAAGILLAFVSGWLVGGVPRSSTPAPTPGSSSEAAVARDRPGAHRVEPSRTSLGSRAEEGSSRRTSPLVRARTIPGSKLPHDCPSLRTSSTSPVRREWERQGYQVQHRSGRVSLELENGQSLDVPVDEVELRCVGNRTY